MGRLLKFLIAALYLPCNTVRCALLRCAGYRVAPPFTVLMYHAVKAHERARFARQMRLLVRLARPVSADLPVDAVVSRSVAVTFDDALRSVLENAIPLLHASNIPFTVFVPTSGLGDKPRWITDERHPNAQERLMTSGELRRLRDLGGGVGSHGVTHRPLTELSDGEALTELSDSRAALEAILDTHVRSFALPYGAGSSREYALARQAGYERIFLSVPAGSDAESNDFVRGRVEASPSDWALEYRLKIFGAYQWLPVAIAAKRGVMRFVHLGRAEAA